MNILLLLVLLVNVLKIINLFVVLYIGREYKSFIIRYSQVKYESIYVVMLKRIHRK